MLKVDNINLYYGAAQALRGVWLSAETRQGHLRARPPMASGKTSLLARHGRAISDCVGLDHLRRAMTSRR